MQTMLEELAVVHRSLPRRSARGLLAAEFPSIHISEETHAEGAPVHLRASEWDRRDFDTWQFDLHLDELAREAFTLRILDDAGGVSCEAPFALGVLNRCQRLIDRRNRHSQGALFTRVLARHRAMHDLAKPLVRADFNHARDVWQWVLRLDPEASQALQLAALFHDVERLASEADARVEHLAADYQDFKDAHARRGAEMTSIALADAGVPEGIRLRVAEIVAAHEHRTEDREVALLNDADALSFFSLNSPGYADYFGPGQTAKKIAYTWNRMSAAARERLDSIHLRADVQTLMQAQLSLAGSRGKA